MKAVIVWVGIAGLVLLTSAYAALHQQAKLALLTAQGRALQAEHAASPNPAPLARSARTAAAGAADASTLELMRLRAEVTRLRARQQELASVRVENQALRERLAKQTLPPGYQRLREAQYVGQQTPDAVLQSFMWALANTDTNALSQLLVGRAAERMWEELREEGKSELLGAARILPGYRLVAIRQKSPSEVTLEVELWPGEGAETMTARLEDGRWRLDP